MNGLDRKSQEKIYYNIRKAQVTNDPELFKKLSATIWEFRTLYHKTYYRLFAFWDKTEGKQTLVIATHGLLKKPGKHLLQKSKKLIVSDNNILNRKNNLYADKEKNKNRFS